MNERRAEQRFMCSDLVGVQLEDQGKTLVANLEDISPSGACLEMPQPVSAGARLILNCADCRFRGKVRYCVAGQCGYQVGVRFMECQWSKQKFEPEHLLEVPAARAGDMMSLLQDDAKASRLLADLRAVSDAECGDARSANRRACCDDESCPRADLVSLMEPGTPLQERVRVVARSVAWTCEKLSTENLKQCFSRWFQLPPECSMCEEFARAYQEEYDVVSNQPVEEKRMAAGGTFDFF